MHQHSIGTAPELITKSTVVSVVSMVSQLLVLSQKTNSFDDVKSYTLLMSGVTTKTAHGCSLCITIEIPRIKK